MINRFKLRAVLIFLISSFIILSAIRCNRYADSVRIGVFKVNASPPINSPVAYIDARSIEDSLWAKGIVIITDDKPLVLCVVDWLGIANVSSDFPGIARDKMEKELGVPFLYFSGAGGNITAGKYNDGSPEQRAVLTGRMKKAMQEAWEQTQKRALEKSDVQWNNVEIMLPLAKHLIEEELVAQLSDASLDSLSKFRAAKHLAWLHRSEEGHRVNISALQLGNVWLLNLPGEACIEYQLAAQEMKPGEDVCTAAYEEYGPGYICTEIAYSQGGYEDSPHVSRVAPETEKVLLNAIEKVLQ